MKTEIIIALIENAKLAFITVSGIGLCVSLLILCVTADEWLLTEAQLIKRKTVYNYLIKASLVMLAILTVSITVPSIDDIWKIRIALVKLELSSSENLQKGVETIERVGKKLECKYLGCEETK